MANSLQSNINNKLLKSFVKEWESATVLTNTVSKQLVNEFDESTGAGSPVKMKRPVQYTPRRTADGDLTSLAANGIKVGSVFGQVSDDGYITVYLENTQVEEALETDQLDELIRPVAEDMVVTQESELAKYMTKNAALISGAPDTAIAKWSDVANAGALFKEIGAPSGKKYAAINSFDEVSLADLQTQLGVNPDVNQAWAGAVVKNRFAGFDQVLTTNNLDEYTTGSEDGTGLALSATPTPLYTGYKDSYQMSITVTGLALSTANVLREGQQLTFATRGLANMRNHKAVRKSGAIVPLTVTVLSDVTSDGAGAATFNVSGCGIFESGIDNSFNTVTSALTSGDAITVNGTVATEYRPALAYCEGFVGMGSVVLPKLHATDSNIMNYKGTSIRVHRFSDGIGNKNRYRFDILPTFACFNPFWGMQLHGNP